MMAYDNSFVLCVLHEGSPVREINGQVAIPFGSEYKVRLKNKHGYLRAKARVWIDGRKVSGLGDFIVNAGETVDLERFLTDNLSSGNKFKFVPLSDRRVNDPTDDNNGFVKVEFYREIDYSGFYKTPKIVPLTSGDTRTWYTNDSNTGKSFASRGSSSGMSPSWTGGGVSTTFTSNSCYNGIPISNNLIGAAGATVEGNHSNQSFVYGQDFQTEAFPVTLTLRVHGIEKLKVVPAHCPGVTPPKEQKERFCRNCGKRRGRRSDKFCSRCGVQYVKWS